MDWSAVAFTPQLLGPALFQLVCGAVQAAARYCMLPCVYRSAVTPGRGCSGNVCNSSVMYCVL